MVGSIRNPSINQTTMKFYFVTEKRMIFPLFYLLGNGCTLLISCLPQVKLFHHLNNQYWLQWNLVLLTIFISNQREKRPHLCRAQSQLLRNLLNSICILTFRISWYDGFLFLHYSQAKMSHHFKLAMNFQILISIKCLLLCHLFQFNHMRLILKFLLTLQLLHLLFKRCPGVSTI